MMKKIYASLLRTCILPRKISNESGMINSLLDASIPTRSAIAVSLTISHAHKEKGLDCALPGAGNVSQ